MSRDELTECERRSKTELDRLLSKAYDGDQWLVGIDVATALTRSRWFNAMILREHNRAVEEITRCLKHPRALDRHDRADLPIKLHVAELAAEHTGAATSLIDHLDSAIYSRSRLATQTLWALIPAAEDKDPNERVPHEVRTLAIAIADAKRAPKRIRVLCEGAETWRQVHKALEALCEWAC